MEKWTEDQQKKFYMGVLLGKISGLEILRGANGKTLLKKPNEGRYLILDQFESVEELTEVLREWLGQ